MSPENKSVSLHDAVKLLLDADDIYLLCHQYPDGDTLGSAAALYLGLRQKGKGYPSVAAIRSRKNMITCLRGLNFRILNLSLSALWILPTPSCLVKSRVPTRGTFLEGLTLAIRN